MVVASVGWDVLHAVVVLLGSHFVDPFGHIVVLFVLLLYIFPDCHLELHFLLFDLQSLSLRLKKALILEEFSFLEVQIGLGDVGFAGDGIPSDVVVGQGLGMSISWGLVGLRVVGHFVVELNGRFELHVLLLKHHFVNF